TYYLTCDFNILRVFLSHEMIFPIDNAKSNSFAINKSILLTDEPAFLYDESTTNNEDLAIIKLVINKDLVHSVEGVNNLYNISNFIPIININAIWFTSDESMDRFQIPVKNIKYPKSIMGVINSDIQIFKIPETLKIKDENSKVLEKDFRRYKFFSGMFGFFNSTLENKEEAYYNYSVTTLVILENIFKDEIPKNKQPDSKYPILEKVLDFVDDSIKWEDLFNYLEKTKSNYRSDLAFFLLISEQLIKDHDFDKDGRLTINKINLFTKIIDTLENNSEIEKHEWLIEDIGFSSYKKLFSYIKSILFEQNVPLRENYNNYHSTSLFIALLPFIYKTFDTYQKSSIDSIVNNFGLSSFEKSLLVGFTGLFNGLGVYDSAFKNKTYSKYYKKYLLEKLFDSQIPYDKEARFETSERLENTDFTPKGFPLSRTDKDLVTKIYLVFDELKKNMEKDNIINSLKTILNKDFKNRICETLKDEPPIALKYGLKDLDLVIRKNSYKTLYKNLENKELSKNDTEKGALRKILNALEELRNQNG
ncbi:MAG: hypothetical protein ACOCP4_05775, partial [Candidatus Woesearchaeota archaeon]